MLTRFGFTRVLMPSTWGSAMRQRKRQRELRQTALAEFGFTRVLLPSTWGSAMRHAIGDCADDPDDLLFLKNIDSRLIMPTFILRTRDLEALGPHSGMSLARRVRQWLRWHSMCVTDLVAMVERCV